MKKFLIANKKSILIVMAFYAIVSIVLNYLDSSLSNELSDKAWIHRVNSTEKLSEVIKNKFKGVELDVVFLEETNTFDVNHPPAKSINLSLFSYLSSLKNNNKSSFWIDFKNLTAENAFTSVTKFDSICSVLKLNKNEFIIESDSPQFLKVFQDSGYKTSYYLPTSLCNTPPEKFELAFEAVKRNVINYDTDYISLDKCNYSLMKDGFPNKPKLLWSFPDHRRFILNPLRLIKIPEQIALKIQLLADKDVEVVLFAYVAQSGNR